MRAMYLANYFVAGCIAFSLRRVGSEFASYGIQSDRFFAGSTGNYLGERMAPGLLFKPVSKDIY